MLDSDVLYSPESLPLDLALFKLQKLFELYELWNKTGYNPCMILADMGLVLDDKTRRNDANY